MHKGADSMLRALFSILRIFGDAKSISNGTYHKRLAKRAIRRPVNRKINKMFR